MKTHPLAYHAHLDGGYRQFGNDTADNRTISTEPRNQDQIDAEINQRSADDGFAVLEAIPTLSAIVQFSSVNEPLLDI